MSRGKEELHNMIIPLIESHNTNHKNIKDRQQSSRPLVIGSRLTSLCVFVHALYVCAT